MKIIKYVSILFISSLLFSGVVFSSQAELELHNIFNKKLIKPLKLGEDKQITLLESLNLFSKEMLLVEDKLKENLLKINDELKTKKNDKEEVFLNLVNERISLTNQLNELEKNKIEKLKNELTSQKMAYYFILKQKLINKFKKAIDVSALTEE